MMRERWGTFSVIDHKNAASLVPEVLLYDRLVLPVPSNDAEQIRWKHNGWEPESLFHRLSQLDDLAIKASWDMARQKEFRKRMENARHDARDMTEEAQKSRAYQMTRRVLAQDQKNVIPQGTVALLVAAYQSEADFREDFILKESGEAEREKLALLLAHRFAVPVEADPEKALEKAIALSRKREFQEKRRQLYDWQERSIQEKIPPEIVVAEMDKMVQAYNQAVESASNKVFWKFAYTIAGVALGLAAAPLGNLLASAGALLAIVQFATFDQQPAIEAGENAPAAMFHEAKKIIEWRH